MRGGGPGPFRVCHSAREPPHSTLSSRGDSRRKTIYGYGFESFRPAAGRMGRKRPSRMMRSRESGRKGAFPRRTFAARESMKAKHRKEFTPELPRIGETGKRRGGGVSVWHSRGYRQGSCRGPVSGGTSTGADRPR